MTVKDDLHQLVDTLPDLPAYREASESLRDVIERMHQDPVFVARVVQTMKRLLRPDLVADLEAQLATIQEAATRALADLTVLPQPPVETDEPSSAEWAQVSAAAFARDWDNDADDVYGRLP